MHVHKQHGSCFLLFHHCFSVFFQLLSDLKAGRQSRHGFTALPCEVGRDDAPPTITPAELYCYLLTSNLGGREEVYVTAVLIIRSEGFFFFLPRRTSQLHPVWLVSSSLALTPGGSGTLLNLQGCAWCSSGARGHLASLLKQRAYYSTIQSSEWIWNTAFCIISPFTFGALSIVLLVPAFYWTGSLNTGLLLGTEHFSTLLYNIWVLLPTLVLWCTFWRCHQCVTSETWTSGCLGVHLSSSGTLQSPWSGQNMFNIHGVLLFLRCPFKLFPSFFF